MTPLAHPLHVPDGRGDALEAVDDPVVVRCTRRQDFDEIIAMCELVYPYARPWSPRALQSHLEVFPEGQFVAVERGGGKIVGMAASLIVLWDDYDVDESWHDFTDGGMFTNHDAAGKTLYGAEVMVHPGMRRLGVGSRLYEARRELVERLGMVRIRAHGRLSGYHRYAESMSARQYAQRVVRGELRDPTLSFQLAKGFRVLAVVAGYLVNDPESLGFAALIEWLNPALATPEDRARQDPAFAPASER